MSAGSRRFGDVPLKPSARPVWEIYAVIQGRIAPTRLDESDVELRERSLWVFPPGYSHGWVGELGKAAQIAVFHFDCVPNELRELTAARGYAQISLEDKDGLVLTRLAKEMLPYVWKASPLLKFHSTRAMMDLTLLILGKTVGLPQQTGMADASARRVDAAENWFRSHLVKQPTLKNLSCETGITEGHLRRLFHAARGCSPKEAMRNIQMARAEEMLAQSDLKLAVVAAECGFTSAQYFCNAFKQSHNMTPTAYRKAKKR